ncbi:hypothetical protein SLS54_004286 [Diplodia seriata]
MPNPYGPSASQVSRFPFASRTSGPAPLFYSATDDFREEDDGLEHEREVADFYALQKSRRQFGGSHLTDSSDMDDHERASKSEHSHGGSRATVRGREPTVQPIQEAEGRERSASGSEASAPSSKGKGFGGWAGTAHSLELAGSKHHGSYYAYIVGMIAAAIGWSVLGAFEGVLGFILDGLIVCWGSEVGSQGTGQSRYCPDAGQLFGEESRRP